MSYSVRSRKCICVSVYQIIQCMPPDSVDHFVKGSNTLKWWLHVLRYSHTCTPRTKRIKYKYTYFSPVNSQGGQNGGGEQSEHPPPSSVAPRWSLGVPEHTPRGQNDRVCPAQAGAVPRSTPASHPLRWSAAGGPCWGQRWHPLTEGSTHKLQYYTASQMIYI